MAGVFRFFCPDLAPDRAVDLPPEEARHARTVLRSKVGDAVVVFDGAGTEGTACVDRVDRNGVTVSVADTRSIPFHLAIRLTLAVALPRSQRQHVLIEKCTELGVFAVLPLISERSVVRPGGNTIEKMRRTAIEAAKQSGRAWVPRIHPPLAFADATRQAREHDLTVVLTPDSSAPRLDQVMADQGGIGTMMAWIGPEGGFTTAECAQAVDAGARVARLGPTVLRVETAAILVTGLAAMAAQD
jgi:16S rRNA (uracil1498-N3)-methyltransferase